MHRSGNARRIVKATVVVAAVVVSGALVVAGVGAGAVLWDVRRHLDRVEVGGLSESTASDVPVGNATPQVEPTAGDPTPQVEPTAGDPTPQGEPTAGDPTPQVEPIADVMNVLVVGSDSREDLDRQDRNDLTLGHDFVGTRTDSLMVVQLDPTSDAVAVLSFPRDLFVERCDGSRGRINGAYQAGVDAGVGGPTCVVETITAISGIPIEHYVEVDFGGFVEFIDELGGVDLYVDEPLHDVDAGLDLQRGCHVLDGIEALAFVRARKIDSDFGRMARQQRLVREIVDQFWSVDVALDAPQLVRLSRAAARAIDTDSGMTLRTVRRLAFTFRDLPSAHVAADVVPATDREIGGVAYVVAKRPDADALFERYAEGTATRADRRGDPRAGDNRSGTSTRRERRNPPQEYAGASTDHGDIDC